ncbi:MAG: glycosyltransferase family 1 protein [Patescibacteria group bacterium]|nr:glycosyltransferase family 1 protein [Patescibacteria group bacterium]
MLIGIDASRANKKHKSGVEWYSYYIIRWLAKLDAQNQYILYTNKPLTGGLLDLTTKQHIDEADSGKTNKKAEFDNNGCQIIKSPHNNFRAKVLSWRLPFFWTQIRLSWEMLIHRPKILFIPAHTLPVIHPRKSIVTIHDIGFERDRKLYSQDGMGPKGVIGCRIINFLVRLFTLGKYRANILDYHSWSSQFALKYAKEIITISNFSRKEIMEVYGAGSAKIKVVYNGYNKSLYKKEEDKRAIKQVISKYGIEEPYIFYVGKLEKKKNTPALIEAYSIAKEKNNKIKHKLVLVGVASHGYDEVEYMIREFNLDNEVVVTGWIPEIDMPYIYSGASAFIFPSCYEGFGIPLLQAMACGIPTAASQAASIPEIAKGAALLFNPNDVRSMAEAIAKIILDNELRQKLIKNGFNRVKDFSWEKCAKETLAEIEKVRITN